MRIQRGFLIGLVPFSLLIAGCGGDDGAPNAAVESETSPQSVATASPVATALSVATEIIDPTAAPISATQVVTSEILPLMFNVNLTSTGPKPEELYIPVGREVQLVMRNRGTTEYHYRVEGLIPAGLLWISEPENVVVREEGITEEDHDAHHDKDFVPWRSESRAGIQPTGKEVHGYTEIGQLEVVRFIATNLGTFQVVDPLHPEFSAQVTVY
ncbi:MAG: hypothetical protein HQ478_12385 [Chloroflexi bacterium]|nr:hypothetical protein [Chloroflexota bacterium]